MAQMAPMGGVYGGWPMPMFPIINQAAVQLIGLRPQPRFSGRVEDWQRFEREWREYESLLKQGYLNLDDRTLLEYLRACLDSASQTNIQRMKDENPI